MTAMSHPAIQSAYGCHKLEEAKVSMIYLPETWLTPAEEREGHQVAIPLPTLCPHSGYPDLYV